MMLSPFASASLIVFTAGVTAYLLCYLLCLVQNINFSYTGSISETRACPSVTQASSHHNLFISNARIQLPGGRELDGLSFNWSYVGPTIVAKLGEEISIDVYNEANTGSSVHWHGMTMRDQAWADGTDGIVQRSILPGQMFRYKFVASPAGTAYYHSHTGLQFGDGLRGPLIVQDPNDPYASEYDDEHVVMLTDQSDIPGDKMLKDLQKNGMAMDMDDDDSDGVRRMAMDDMGPAASDDDHHDRTPACKGVIPEDYSDAAYYTLLTNGKGWVPDPNSRQPVGAAAVFRVEQGKRYRFRIIAGVTNWAVKMNISSHSMDIIALDGVNVARTSTQAFVITPGERVDFILTANQPIGNYWINLATLTGHNSPAVLSYVGAAEPASQDPQLSPPTLELGCEWRLTRPDTMDLKLRTPPAHPGTPPPPKTASKLLAMYLVDSNEPTTSYASLLMGSNGRVPGLATHLNPVQGCQLADGTASKYCWNINWVPFMGPLDWTPLLLRGESPSPQTYVEELTLGAVVDVVMINPSGMVHPMHLHGHKFWLLGSGNGVVLLPNGSVDYRFLNTKDPVMRDNHPVPQAIPAEQGPSPSRGMSSSMPGMGEGEQGGDQFFSPPSDMSASSMSGMRGGEHVGDQFFSPPGDTSASSMPGMGGGDQVHGSNFGYSVIRFVADNPGIWLFHCHTDLHAASSMMMAFKVKGAAAAGEHGGGGALWKLPRDAEVCGLDMQVQKSRSHYHMGLPVKLRLV